jgi:hypothetical protein
MDVPNGGNGEESQSAPERGGPKRLDFYRAPELNCHATLGTTSGGSVTRVLRANIPPKRVKWIYRKPSTPNGGLWNVGSDTSLCITAATTSSG